MPRISGRSSGTSSCSLRGLSGSDPQTLEQYRNAANLRARIDLHRRFSTSPISWNRWVFDQMRLPEGARVLELGAGTGLLWSENRDRLPGGVQAQVRELAHEHVRLGGTQGVETQALREQAAGYADQVLNNCMRTKGFTREG